MTALTNVEIGSVVITLVSNVPAGVSGLMPTLVNQAIYTAENYTGVNIPVNAVQDAYQPAIISLSIGNTLGLMEAQGLGTKSVKVGELSLTKGINEGTSSEFKKLGMSQLNDLGHGMSYYTTWN